MARRETPERLNAMKTLGDILKEEILNSGVDEKTATAMFDEARMTFPNVPEGHICMLDLPVPPGDKKAVIKMLYDMRAKADKLAERALRNYRKSLPNN